MSRLKYYRYKLEYQDGLIFVLVFVVFDFGDEGILQKLRFFVIQLIMYIFGLGVSKIEGEFR